MNGLAGADAGARDRAVAARGRPVRGQEARGALAGLRVWAGERFPLSHAPLFLACSLAAAAVGRFGTQAGPVRPEPTDAVVFVACWAFFLLLRVLDEHKDHAEDLSHYPERALSRGLVTLGQLKGVGTFAFTLTLGASLHADHGFGRASRLFLLVMAWVTLMTAEFFARTFLRGRPLLYALSHMAVMSLVFAWLAAVGARGAGRGPLVAGAGLAPFFLGLAVELVRKTRGPEEERDGVDSYSRVFGVRQAPLVALAVLGAGLGVEARLLRVAGAPRPVLGALVLALLLAGAALVAFRRAPSGAARRRAEGAVALGVLVAYLALAAGLMAARGIA